MKNFKSIDRIHESHDMGVISPEVLSMTVEDLLNKLESMDTQDSAEYEIIEDAIKSLSDKLVGYDNDSFDVYGDGVEVDNEYGEFEMEGDDDDDFPTFGDAEADNLQSQERDSLNDFTF
jgi:hypothetical protein